jgi:predicted lipoprotein with Yx(FWY)xxD motif
MRKSALFLSLALALALSVASSALAMHHEVKIAKKDGVGSYLTDTEGMTLYWFKNDSPGVSACSGGCVDKWPLYSRMRVQPPAGVNAEDFGTIKRDDGKEQTTFRGYPLYYYALDKAAGDTRGQNVGEAWFVIDPANFPVGK